MVQPWILGVVLGTTGSIGNNLGNNLVSLGHKCNHEKERAELRAGSCNNLNAGDELTSNPDHSEGPDQSGEISRMMSMKTDVDTTKLQRPEEDPGIFSWCFIGRVVFVVGNLVSFASFGFGAQSLIASLDSVQFVSNVIFGYFVHNEPATVRVMIATISILVGNVMVVLFGNRNAQELTSDDMIHLYETNHMYHGYLVFAFFTWLINHRIYRVYEDARMNHGKELWNHAFVEPFCFAVSSAVIGTQAVLNSKSLALLLESTRRGDKNEFAFWYLYFILATWLIMVSYWLQRLDSSLEKFPPMFIIPVMQVFFVLFAIICGGIYFREFVSFTLEQYIGFVLGVLLILFGVVGLAPKDMALYFPDEVEIEARKAAKNAKKVLPEAPLSKEEEEEKKKKKEEQEAAAVDVVDLEAAGKVPPSVRLSTRAPITLFDPELDQKSDALLSKKPTPGAEEEETNLFTKAAQAEEEEEELAVAAALGVSKKKSRKVVRRPVNDFDPLPPIRGTATPTTTTTTVVGTAGATTRPTTAEDEDCGNGSAAAAPSTPAAAAVATNGGGVAMSTSNEVMTPLLNLNNMHPTAQEP